MLHLRTCVRFLVSVVAGTTHVCHGTQALGITLTLTCSDGWQALVRGSAELRP